MKHITILGVGNTLWADEGFGVRAVQALHTRYVFPPNVRLIDGGAQDLALLPVVEEADVLILVDAVEFGQEPGALVLADDDDVPHCLAAKPMSLHQTGVVDALGLAKLHGTMPLHVRLIGMQPLDLENYGGPVTGPVRAQINAAMAEVLAYLTRFGVAARPRAAHEKAPKLAPASAALDNYEAGCFA
ncbi:HyaD/HybD family hydrogenase maturation endopeptidase [Acidocella sp. KAb 2-4]|uniref:HyaD/HybD family hydrogenase maturation endopeptidase n=1 Tax=Acidocella sp. KAb 2-4 TaxID=2885158 RepID=UPI001D07BE24|nr:HyaD/HybD family hydrogenase maturation endopeptidase [Acidocella sp. KAb 2-4]MCB5944416.1 HyaD/HybD family hydrogenase maturation endopeptidase [Acidocella sp. KAb 2-4]